MLVGEDGTKQVVVSEETEKPWIHSVHIYKVLVWAIDIQSVKDNSKHGKIPSF